MSKKIISTLLLVIFSSVFVNAGVTNIKEIVNNTSGIVTVRKIETTDDIYTSPNETTKDIPVNGVWSGDMWIPWANNKDEFLRHTIMLEIKIPDGNHAGAYRLIEFFIWQSGDFVRFTKMKSSMRESYVDNAPKVPGVAKVDG
ncbi:MAG: hypothetical protein H0U50_08270, partial [Pyrinomonadaceae bacterium]|nr:hypothetical protein [Pyrinomonadaceae bacterium]